MKRIRKCVVPVAGYGTRMYPASKAVKKEFFPVVDVSSGRMRPILQCIIEEAVAAGIEEVCLVTQPGDDAVFRAYFSAELPPSWRGKLELRDWAKAETGHLAELGQRLAYVEQTVQEGFGHAVYAAREWVGDEPFMLMLGDHLYVSGEARRCAAQLLDAHAALGGTVVAVERAGEDQLPLCGTVRGEPLPAPPGAYRAAEFAEKPAVEYARRSLRTPGLPEDRFLCFFGQYAIDAAVFDALNHLIRHDIREGGEIQFTAALDLLRQQGAGAFALETRGHRLDTGVPLEYARTLHELALRAARG